MARKTKYDSRGIAHIYQRGFNMSVIFYSVKDILVFYTILYVLKKKYKITVLGIVFMYNHYHLLIKARSQEVVSCFMRDLETVFSKEFNKEAGIKGHVFEPRYGLSNKNWDKKQREAAAYLYNNPVEKQLSTRAVEFRWNFLAYAVSDHPFSEKMVVRKASTHLKKCLQEVRFMFNHGDFLNYTVLKNCFKRLPRNEINQLVDFIITTYNVVDYKETINLYGSYEKMLIAFDSNTGSDHDMKEEYSDNSYKGYISSIKALSNVYRFAGPKDVLKLSDEERRFLARKLANQLNVSRFITETLLRIYKPKKERLS